MKNKKLNIVLSVILTVVLVTAAILIIVFTLPPKKQVAHLIVLAGQSNCEGVSSKVELKKRVSEQDYLLYETGFNNVNIEFRTNGVSSNTFVPVKLGQGTSENYFGIEVGIADYLSKTYPKEKFYLVKRAHGGTALFPHWFAPRADGSKGMFYEALLNEIDSAILELENNNMKVIVEAFCFMQGEQETNDLELVNQYYNNLVELINHFRNKYKEYNKNTIKFIDGGISDRENHTYYKEINQIKKDVSNLDESNYFIDTIEMGLSRDQEPEGNVDTIHYDSLAMLSLGREFGKYCL